MYYILLFFSNEIKVLKVPYYSTPAEYISNHLTSEQLSELIKWEVLAGIDVQHICDILIKLNYYPDYKVSPWNNQ